MTKIRNTSLAYTEYLMSKRNEHELALMTHACRNTDVDCKTCDRRDMCHNFVNRHLDGILEIMKKEK